MDIQRLGWNSSFDALFKAYRDKGLAPARVVTGQGSIYRLAGDFGETTAQLTGKFRYQAERKKDYPAVGDWVAIEMQNTVQFALIHALVERRNCFARKLPISGGRKIKNGRIDGGSTQEQVIAANIDIAFIVSGLDGDLNLRRLERYLTLVHGTGAIPVVLLNKADLCEDVAARVLEVAGIARDAAVHSLSAARGETSAIRQYLQPGRSAIFIGSSGVGKSSIINLLLGREQQRTAGTNVTTGKGRHTTTSRQLLLHPGGGIIIDTPGLRELQLWAGEDDIDSSFSEITAVFGQCKFNDCRHGNEPGCAIRRALADGTIRPERYAAYQAQVNELERLEKRKKEFAIRMGQKKAGQSRRGAKDDR